MIIRPMKRYRAERHYMRGPGPKWREKHGEIDRVGPVTDSHCYDKYLLASFFFQLVRRWQAGSSGTSRARR